VSFYFLLLYDILCFVLFIVNVCAFYAFVVYVCTALLPFGVIKNNN